MKKSQFLQHFEEIKSNQTIAINPIPYKHEGSTYDCDGIRITGSTQFIDSVLSRLKDLLDHENNETRLQCVYKQSTDRNTKLPMDSYNCYLQVHRRGGQSIMLNNFISSIRQKQTA